MEKVTDEQLSQLEKDALFDLNRVEKPGCNIGLERMRAAWRMSAYTEIREQRLMLDMLRRVLKDTFRAESVDSRERGTNAEARLDMLYEMFQMTLGVK